MSIAVIIPTYNRKRLLRRAIDSVLEQTWRASEIIVVDDQSDFDVRQDVQDIYTDRGVDIVVNSQNLGAAQSRNIGVEKAKSHYVAFLDSDDYWDASKLEKQMRIAAAHPEAGCLYCDQWRVDKAGNIHKSNRELFDEHLWEHLLQGWTAPNTSTLVFRKDVFEKLGGFDPELTSCQDHDLWMRVALEEVIVKYSSERLSYFTQGAENRISLDYERRVKGAVKFLEKWRDDITVSRNSGYYQAFRNSYLNEVILPIMLVFFQQKKFFKALRIYAKYLLLNPAFYMSITRRFGRFSGKER